MSGFMKIAAKCAAFSSSIFKAFFEINDDESFTSGSKKVGLTAARRVVYVIADYWTALACAALVGSLKYWGLSFWGIAVATWLFDFLVAFAFMVASEKSGQDITLGESFRRVADVIHSSSKLAGFVSMIGLTIKATIWDGPEQVAIFFKKELGSMKMMTFVVFALTFVQGVFWAWVYGLGYESVAELLKGLV